MRVLLIAAVALFMGAPAPVLAEALDGAETPGDVLAATTNDDWSSLDPEETLYIDVESGRAVVLLSPRLAPAHVARIKELARAGFYDGLTFYRVIDGFVAQGGDALGVKGEDYEPLAAEFETNVDEDFAFYRLKDRDGYAPAVGFHESLPVGHDKKRKSAWGLHCAGAVAFARDTDADSATTEFYIALQPQRYLDRNLTVIGRVVDGMDHVQRLRRVAPPQSAEDDQGDAIIFVKVAADLPESERTPLEILRSDREIFDRYVAARRNRADEFFYHRPDYVDVCQLPIPVRPAGAK